MSTIVGLIGFIGCGKGTVASYISKKYDLRHDSFAASLKDACANIFGWPRHLLEGDTAESRKWREQVDCWWEEKLGIDGFTPRLALQLMGTNVIRDNFNDNIWFLSLERRIMQDTASRGVVISDVRFQNEFEFIRKNKGLLIRIYRGPEPEWYITAMLANQGDADAINTMKTKYSDVHYSEWAWAGISPDYIVDNNGTIENLEQQLDNIFSNHFKSVI